MLGTGRSGTVIAMPRKLGLLTRYERGQHEAAWAELRRRKLDATARDEVAALAAVTMRRVAHNVELLVARFAKAGWKALSGKLHTPPGAADHRAVKEIEKITGAPLPPSLSAFFTIVGGVDLVWDYERGDVPDLAMGIAIEDLDPLSVDPARRTTSLFDEWAEGEGPPFALDLAPDALHKGNISGGAPYGVTLPSLDADPRFGNDEMSMPFIDYLRLACRWGGFPGLARQPARPPVKAFVSRMTEGFEPF